MRLFIHANDLHEHTLGLIEDAQFLVQESFTAPPEQLLASVDALLNTQTVQLENLEGLVVVQGPGSFTAIRTAVALANTLAFVHGLVLFPIVLPDEVDEATILTLAQAAEPVDVVLPHYDRPPNIT